MKCIQKKLKTLNIYMGQKQNMSYCCAILEKKAEPQHRSPSGCVLSPLLYILVIDDCVAKHYSNTIIKFADDTRVEGLIKGNSKSACREEVRHLAVWCQDNNLSLNVRKTKVMIVYYRKRWAECPHSHERGCRGAG